LEAFNITVVGNIPRNAEQEIDFSKLIIPLKTRNGNQEALCMAIPFLRQGDYPILPNSTQPYSDGVSKLYEDAFNYAKKCLKPNEGIVAMGHLHTLNAVPSTDDKSERIIMGGIEFVPASAFNPDIAYTALGHIHKAQKVAQKDNIRYSGSPIPMSFSELNYKHQIIYFELDKGISKSIQGIEIPLLIPLKIIPAKPQKLTEVLAEIEKLPGQTNDFHLSPYLEIQVLIDGPEPSLKFQLERALEGKNVRLARIKTFSRQNLTKDELVKNSSESEELKNIKPLDLFYKVYQQKYDGQLPAKELVDLFNVVVSEISE
jgi:exonuclease SbcD